MTGRLLGAACLLVAIGACSSESKGDDDDNDDLSPPGNTAPDKPVGEAPTDSPLKFAASAEAADAGDYTQQFPMLDTRDVIAVIPVERAPGVFFIRVDVYQPGGTSFSTIWRAYSSDSDAPETVLHPELGVQVAVMRLRPDDPPRLYLGIGIAGTQIPEFGLTGVFPVEVRFATTADVTPTYTSAFEIVLDMSSMGM